jgi:hypothetical protein
LSLFFLGAAAMPRAFANREPKKYAKGKIVENLVFPAGDARVVVLQAAEKFPLVRKNGWTGERQSMAVRGAHFQAHVSGFSGHFRVRNSRRL